MTRYDIDRAEQIIMRFPGARESAVRHPSEMYPDWDNWSTAAKVRAQQKYELYVANWRASRDPSDKHSRTR